MRWRWPTICALIGVFDVSLVVTAIGGLKLGAFCAVFLGFAIGILIRRSDPRESARSSLIK
jgi:uncharacterized membrane protein